MAKSIYYRQRGERDWTRDREAYGTAQDDRRVRKLRSQRLEVLVTADDPRVGNSAGNEGRQR